MIVEKREDGRVATEATIKICRRAASATCATAEGNGPVNALDKALRERDRRALPAPREIELVNFKVRILDETKGTAPSRAC